MKMKLTTFTALLLFIALTTIEAFVYHETDRRGWTPRGMVASTDRNELVREVLSYARNIGPVGVLSSTEKERDDLLEMSRKLKDHSNPKPARYSLKGTFDLVYSAHPGPPSGRLGPTPFYGKATQTFLDDETYINAVKFGPLRVTIQAEIKVKDDWTNEVRFYQTTVSLFGKRIVKKDVDISGGEWRYLFLGQIEDANGRRKLIRVMETPRLFILEQPIERQ